MLMQSLAQEVSPLRVRVNRSHFTARPRICSWCMDSGARTRTSRRPPVRGRGITGVVVARNGYQEQYSADILVVACGALSSAWLLRSDNDAHPNGLAN
jgi:hypothetical protein